MAAGVSGAMVGWCCGDYRLLGGRLVAWMLLVAIPISGAVVVDARIRRLPHILILPSLSAAVAASWASGLGWAVVGGVVWAGVYAVIACTGGIGGGDITTAAAAGVLVCGDALAAHMAPIEIAVVLWGVIVAAQLSTVVLALALRSRVVAHGPHLWWPVVLAVLAS